MLLENLAYHTTGPFAHSMKNQNPYFSCSLFTSTIVSSYMAHTSVWVCYRVVCEYSLVKLTLLLAQKSEYI